MLAEIVSRLQSQIMPPFNLVAGAAEYASLAAPPPTNRQPAAYVIPLKDDAGPNELVTATQQQVRSEFGVIIICSAAAANPAGDKAIVAIETARASVRQALINWQIASSYGFVEYAGGDLIGFEGGCVQWQDVFRTKYYIRKTT